MAFNINLYKLPGNDLIINNRFFHYYNSAIGKYLGDIYNIGIICPLKVYNKINENLCMIDDFMSTNMKKMMSIKEKQRAVHNYIEKIRNETEREYLKQKNKRFNMIMWYIELICSILAGLIL